MMRKYFPLMLVFFYTLTNAQIQFDSQIITEYKMTSGELRLASADLDGDGDNDIISASSKDDKISWFENTYGKGNFSNQILISLNADGASDVAVGDIDQDGDFDIISASYNDNKIAWYENDGHGNFSEEIIITSSALGARDIYLADLDGDGDLDIVSASELDNEVNWYKNDQGEFSDKINVSNNVSRAYSVYAADMDFDGDNDIVAASFESGIVTWYENLDGNEDFSDQHFIGNYNSGIVSVIAEDLTGDNLPDIIVGLPATVFWLKNKVDVDGERYFGDLDYLKKEGGSQNILTKQLSVADIDNDGDLDVISVCERGSYWYKNSDGKGNFACANYYGAACDLNNLIDNAPADSVFPIDLDSDGDIDIIRGVNDRFSKSEIFVNFNSDGIGLYSNRIIVNSEVERITETKIADINNDGLKDVITFSENRISIFKAADGNGSFHPAEMIFTNTENPQSLKIEDLDGDGNLDIIYSSSYYDNGKKVYARIAWLPNSDGLGNFEEEILINSSTSLSSLNRISLADADSDGDIDIFLARNDQIFLYKNETGLGRDWSENVVSANPNTVGRIYAEDLDQDGDKDILICSAFHENQMVWYKNIDGKGNYGSEIIILDTKGSTVEPSIADLDGDGDLDIVSSDRSRNIFWIENINGQGDFSQQHEIRSPLSEIGYIFRNADVDNDGDLDLIVTTENRLSNFDILPWFENTDGLGNFGNMQSIPINRLTASQTAMEVGDIDADGDIDILTASLAWENLTWYRNLGLANTEINGFINFNINQDDCANGIGLDRIMVTKEKGTNTEATFSISNGFYQFFSEPGEYTFSLSSNFPEYYSINPTSQTINISDEGTTDEIDFCLSANQIVNDLSISLLPLSESRPGFESNYELVFKNYGTTTLSGNIILNFNLNLTLNSTTGEPLTQTENSVSFEFENLEPFSERKINLNFLVSPPPTINIGDILNFSAIINPTDGDLTPEDNEFSFNQVVVGSYDPNDITVLEGESIKQDQVKNYLNYIIRFQNTGTSEAINVKIKHDLDENLDWTTFKPLASSHSEKITIKDGKHVEFNFENINLPDSTSNEKESHGYVAFKIKPKTGVSVGDIIKGKAGIYFDFNLPVITNEVSTTIIDERAGDLSIEIINKAEISCNSLSDAEVEIEVAGGVSAYEYQLLDNEDNIIATSDGNIFSNLPAGNYTVRVTDSDSHEISKNFEILEPEVLMGEVASTPTTCIGLLDGKITATATGGTAPYEYRLNDQSYIENNEFSDLAPGEYEVWVKDSNDCTFSQSITVSEASGSDMDGDGIGDDCDDDIDGDGVLNADDNCNDTGVGEPVDSEGCAIFTLAISNFTISNISETCRSSNNGKIEITAEATHEYMAILTGNGINQSNEFTSETAFGDLQTGTYQLCITLAEEPEYEQCFTIQIDEPEPLEVNSSVNMANRSVRLDLKGSQEYIIKVNDQIYRTTEDEIELSLSADRNTISVSTALDCQGSFSEQILLGSELVLYPNPVTNGELSIKLPNSNTSGPIKVIVYSDNGRLVLSKQLSLNEGNFRLVLDGVVSGVYTLKIDTEEKSYYSRIIKK